MQLIALLNAVQGLIDVTLLAEGYEIGLDWLGQFARIIIEGVGIVGLGIIVFNLVLKAITLPFDIYQRVNSRKQNLVMEQMQPELEKLQKQYKDDKQMYNQKMLELQKKNGYSMMGACLPMIVSFVIIIVAWQGFRAYSQYANLSYFVRMSESYNAAILKHGVEGRDVTLSEGVLHWQDGETEKTAVWQEGGTLPVGGGVTYTMTVVGENENARKYLDVAAEDTSKFIRYRYNLEVSNSTREYYADEERMYGELSQAGYAGNEAAQAAVKAIADYRSDRTDTNFNEMKAACVAYVVNVGASAAAETFRADDPSFLWIKNVWYPDVSYSHPIPNSHKDFSSSIGNAKVTFPNDLDENGKPRQEELGSVIGETQYNNLTSLLTEEKSAANGYYILVVLSIGFMLLSQLIVMKSSKATNKYNTVDGQGMATQKVMLVVMPLIYAMFAFSYSAAFSIYMTMSSVVSIIVTLLSNLILGHVFKKKERKAQEAVQTRRLPWMKDGKDKGKDKDKHEIKNESGRTRKK